MHTVFFIFLSGGVGTGQGDLACQDYFTYFEPSQWLNGAKMGDP